MPRRGWPTAFADSRVSLAVVHRPLRPLPHTREEQPCRTLARLTLLGSKLGVSIDQHKLSLVAATRPASGGTAEVVRLGNAEQAVRRFVEKLGGPEGLAVCYDGGVAATSFTGCWPGWEWCAVTAPSLIPIRAGEDRVKTDRHEAKKLVPLYRVGELVFVHPPSPQQEVPRELVRCRDDLRQARTAARHRIAKQLLRYGHIYRDGKS